MRIFPPRERLLVVISVTLASEVHALAGVQGLQAVRDAVTGHKAAATVPHNTLVQ